MNVALFGYSEVYYQSQLKGLLHDIVVVYERILQSGVKLPNNENTIRNEFGKYFSDQSYKVTCTTAKDYYYDFEVSLQKTAGRVDMRFLSPNCLCVQDYFFGIECKRLDGTRHLSKEYVVNGIRRFTTGKYPSYLGCNAMLGFVVCPIDLDETVGYVNNNLTVDEYLQQVGTTARTVGFESHHTSPHHLVLYHLWMNFVGLIIKETEN
ncbi:MAG: hypothetical protein IKS65_02940 [Bacteroidales bacterium]|nr:hypothetical protein [Bacteroidales bacterium]